MLINPKEVENQKLKKLIDEVSRLEKENQELKNNYNELLVFCFRNINPFVSFDIKQVKQFWENLIK